MSAIPRTRTSSWRGASAPRDPRRSTCSRPRARDRRHQELAKHVVRYRDRTPVWDKAGFARVAYVGEGGAPAHGYRMDMIHLPKGVAVKPYVRDVEDVYFVLDGAITAGWVQDGEVVERRLGARDLLFNPAGRPHYFRNDGVERREVHHGGGLRRA